MDSDFIPERVIDYSIEYRGGRNDGLTFFHQTENDIGFWISDTFPGKKFKQVFVPLDMEHPSFLGR